MAETLRVIVRPATLPEDCEAVTTMVGQRAVVLFDPRKTASTHRLRWNIAHELGHIVCAHTGPSSVAEAEANWFAACLLMPRPWLLQDLRQAGESLASTEQGLRCRYKVGRQSLLIRVRYLGLLPESR